MAVQFPALMRKLGLTDAAQKVALIDPGFKRAAVTTRLDGFIHGQEIELVGITRRIRRVFPIRKD